MELPDQSSMLLFVLLMVVFIYVNHLQKCYQKRKHQRKH